MSARGGNDANSCDNVATPCQTFAGAVLQVAAGGEVTVLDSGGYGPVSITKAVTIEAPPGIVAFIHTTTFYAVQVAAGASDHVVLRGLSLNGGGGNGIIATSVGELHVENCVIEGFAFEGVSFRAAGALFLLDTTARDNGNEGIGVVPTAGPARASITRCAAEGNVTAGFVVEGNAVATIADSVAAGNGSDGIFVDATTGGGPQVTVRDCLLTNNGASGISGNGGGGRPAWSILIGHSTASQNGIGFFLDNFGTFYSVGDNLIGFNLADIGGGGSINTLPSH